jgi:phosphoribosylformylglycinamidine (FGAM) synthase PurS component
LEFCMKNNYYLPRHFADSESINFIKVKRVNVKKFIEFTINNGNGIIAVKQHIKELENRTLY